MSKFVIVTAYDRENKVFGIKTLVNLSKVDSISEESMKEDCGKINIITFNDSSIGIKESIDYICKNAFSFEEEEIFSWFHELIKKWNNYMLI